jgi:hypothetical protein
VSQATRLWSCKDRYVTTFHRLDEYFCERCLEHKERKQQVTVGEFESPPGWAREPV